MDLPARDLLLTVCTSCKYVTTGELSELLFTPARVLLQSTTHKQNFAENSKNELRAIFLEKFDSLKKISGNLPKKSGNIF